MEKAVYTKGHKRGQVIEIYTPLEVRDLISLPVGAIVGMMDDMRYRGVIGFIIETDLDGHEGETVVFAINQDEAVVVPELSHLEVARIEMIDLWERADRRAEECLQEGLDELATLYGARCKALDDCLKIITDYSL